MVRFNNISVHVLRADKSPYPEYTIPARSPKFPGKQNEVYIEAVTGERFEIVTRLDKHFDFKGRSHLRVTYSVDGMRIHEHVSSQSVQKALSNGSAYYQDCYSTSIMNVQGALKKCGLTFAALTIDEDADHSDGQIASDADQYGTIVVKVFRGAAEQERIRPLEKAKIFPEVEACSVGVIKKGHVSHAMRFAVLGDSSGRVRELGRSTKAAGADGRLMTFTIRYRSLASLELLKIVAVKEDLDDQATQQGLLTNDGQEAQAQGSQAETFATLDPEVELGSEQSISSSQVRMVSAKGLRPDGALDTKLQYEPPGRKDIKSTSEATQPPASPAVKLNPGPGNIKREPNPTVGGSKRKSVAVKRERPADDDDNDLQIVSSRVASSARSPAVAIAPTSSPTPSSATQAERERKQALIKIRQRELELERWRLAMERELLELE